MSVPTCPQHGSPLREGRKGGWYCPKKVGEGFCNFRISAKGQSYGAEVQVDSSQESIAATMKATDHVARSIGQMSVTSVDANWLASLDFAAMVYRGTGEAAKALDLATAARALLP